MKNVIRPLIVSLFMLSASGCRKFVQVDPPITQLVNTSVFESDATASAAVTGIYQSMTNTSTGGGNYGLSAVLGLSSDEITLYSGVSDGYLSQIYENSLISNAISPIWQNMYNIIYQTNVAIEGMSASSKISPNIKKQLIGEVKFIRAFCYFYLTNLYGDVPLSTTTNYKLNAGMARNPVASVYQQIIEDLKDAQEKLDDSYHTPSGDITTARVRPNKASATALLARVYLYLHDWINAEIQATTVIGTSAYKLLTNLNQVFLKNSDEAIWQLEIPNTGQNTPDASIFLLSYFGGPNPSRPFILNESLISHFESGDLRKINWTDSVVIGSTVYKFPSKYKLVYTGAPPEEYPTILRLAEQYLIRSEARAQLNKLSEAQADLNSIRSRAGLPNTNAATKNELLTAILTERRLELFTEYGHRWLDLKRTGNVDAVMSLVTPLKGGTWQTTDQLYPIPQSEIRLNPNLTQNPGYQ